MKSFLVRHAVTLIGVLAVTALGIAVTVLKAPTAFWLLVAAVGALVVLVYWEGAEILALAKANQSGWAVAAMAIGAVVFLLLYLSVLNWPREAKGQRAGAPSGTGEGADKATAPLDTSVGNHTGSAGSGTVSKREEPPPPRRAERAPQIAQPARALSPNSAPASPIVVTPGGNPPACELIPPDRPPNVVLKSGEVVFAAEGGLFRLDHAMMPQRILVSEELAEARGIAVEATGSILVSTKACGSGVILRVDPKSGQQTLVASGFKTPKAILIEPSGTLLVSDEVGGDPVWGHLWRLNLRTGEQESIYPFLKSAQSEVATGIAVDPNSGDIFFARRGLYRMSGAGVSRMQVEGVLRATSTTMFGGNLLVSADGPAVIEMTPAGEVVSTKAGGGPITDLVARGKQVFVGYGNGRVGKIRETDGQAENVWESKPSNYGVFVAVVPNAVTSK
jgi:hypothetical protein